MLQVSATTWFGGALATRLQPKPPALSAAASCVLYSHPANPQPQLVKESGNDLCQKFQYPAGKR